MREFMKKEIDGLTVDKVYVYVKDFLLTKVSGKLQSQKSSLLKHYRIKDFDHSTAWRWMKALGMKYSDRRKNYYVDGHEREDVILSRNIFVKEYLIGEMRMHRWVQLPLVQAIHQGLDIESGYHYISESSETFIEFHVDANDVAKKFGNGMNFGGNLSVRFPENEKILLSFGHDEVIFNKNAFSNKC